MQNDDSRTVSMKWLVTFRQQQQNCCPPRKYWVVRKETVEAPSAEEAVSIVAQSWRYNHPIEIKTVTRIDHEPQGE